MPIFEYLETIDVPDVDFNEYELLKR